MLLIPTEGRNVLRPYHKAKKQIPLFGRNDKDLWLATDMANSDISYRPARSAQTTPHSDTLFYVLAVAFGSLIGVVNVKIGDLLFTALLVVASCMLLAALRPGRPWRWVAIVGIFVPIVELLAYLLLTQKPYRAEVYESFLAFFPGIAGAYGGSMMRGVIDNVLHEK
jgi:hypothetical protein